MIKIPVTQLVVGIILIIAFICLFIFIRLKEKIKLKQFYKWLTILILTISLGLCSGGNVLVHLYIKNNYDKLYYYTSDSYMYSSFSSGYASLQKFGFYGYYLEDFCRRVFPFCKTQPPTITDLYEYEYYTSILDSLCEDNNVIMIYAESFDIFGITKELTPVLYAMKKGADLSQNGITEFYNVSKNNGETTINRKDFSFNGTKYTYNNTNIFNNTIYNEVGLELFDYVSTESTNHSEHKSLAGCGYTNYNASYTLPKMLYDYNSTYIHGNWGSFYNRDSRMESSIGFDKAFYLDDMEDFQVGNKKFDNGSINVCSLDSLTLKHYTDNNNEYNIFPTDEKFFAYFMTVTTHGAYQYSEFLENNYLLVDAVIENYSSSADFELYNSLGEGLKSIVREYFARVLDTEYALAYLVNYLHENEILDKTIITFTGDHNAYSNNIHLYKQLYLKEILNINPNIYNHNTEGFIYSTQIKNSYLSENNENRVISNITDATDLAPTLLTLLGKDFKQELFMGNAVINKSVENPAEIVNNKIARSYTYGSCEDDYFKSSDGSTIKYKIPDYQASQKQLEDFKINYNKLFMKYYYVLEQRSK